MPDRSADIDGRLTMYTSAKLLYVKRDGMAFRAQPKAKDEWPVETVQWRVEKVLELKRHVMIENEKGEIVFLARYGKVEFPRDAAAFWRECGK